MRSNAGMAKQTEGRRLALRADFSLVDLWLADFLFFLDFLTLEDGTDTLFRNVGEGLPLGTA
jgi:hypothetical protein